MLRSEWCRVQRSNYIYTSKECICIWFFRWWPKPSYGNDVPDHSRRYKLKRYKYGQTTEPGTVASLLAWPSLGHPVTTSLQLQLQRDMFGSLKLPRIQWNGVLFTGFIGESRWIQNCSRNHSWSLYKLS
jgi:hypothetical protein